MIIFYKSQNKRSPWIWPKFHPTRQLKSPIVTNLRTPSPKKQVNTLISCTMSNKLPLNYKKVHRLPAKSIQKSLVEFLPSALNGTLRVTAQNPVNLNYF